MTGLLCSFLKKCHSLSVIILIGVLWKKWWVQLSHVLFLDNHHVLIYNRSLMCISHFAPKNTRKTYLQGLILSEAIKIIKCNWPASPPLPTHPPPSQALAPSLMALPMLKACLGWRCIHYRSQAREGLDSVGAAGLPRSLPTTFWASLLYAFYCFLFLPLVMRC